MRWGDARQRGNGACPQGKEVVHGVAAAAAADKGKKEVICRRVCAVGLLVREATDSNPHQQTATEIDTARGKRKREKYKCAHVKKPKTQRGERPSLQKEEKGQNLPNQNVPWE